jgi:hypothetical protein
VAGLTARIMLQCAIRDSWPDTDDLAAPLQAALLKPPVEGIGPRRTPEPNQFLGRELRKLAAKLSAEEPGQDIRQERGLEFGIELRKQRRMLRGKEPDKELVSFFGKQRNKQRSKEPDK